MSLPALPTNYTKPQEEARKYIEQHDLHHFFNLLLNQVVQTKPSLPKVFMIKTIAERCTHDQLSSAGIRIDGHGVSSNDGKPAHSPRHATANQETEPEVDSHHDASASVTAQSAMPMDAATEVQTAAVAETAASGDAPTEQDQRSQSSQVPASQSPSQAPSKESTSSPQQADSSNLKVSDSGPEAAGVEAETSQNDADLEDGAAEAPPTQVVIEVTPPADESPADPNVVVNTGEAVHVAEENQEMVAIATVPEDPPVEEAVTDHVVEVNPGSSTADQETPAKETPANEAEQMDAFDMLAEAQEKEEEEEKKDVEPMAQELAPNDRQEATAELEEPSRTEPAPADSEEMPTNTEAGTDENQSSSFMSAWASVKSFQDLCGVIEAGVALPEQGQMVGSPLWLADILAKDGPDPVVTRLTWLIQQTGIELPGPTSKGVDLAMALAQSIGKGPWLQFLYAHNVCQEGAVDSSGRTVESYIEDFDMINSSLGCLNLDSGPDDAQMTELAEEASATAQNEHVASELQAAA